MLLVFAFILGFTTTYCYYSDLIVVDKGVEMLNRYNTSCYGMSCDTVCDCCLKCRESEDFSNPYLIKDDDWSTYVKYLNATIFYPNGSIYATQNITFDRRYYEEKITWHPS